MATVTVTFGSDSRADHAITGGWIRAAMEALRQAGLPVCGSVSVRGGEINLALPVGDCRGGLGGGRQRNAAEAEVIRRWRQLHLDEERVSPGELEAFVRQALRM